MYDLRGLKLLGGGLLEIRLREMHGRLDVWMDGCSIHPTLLV